MPHSQTKSPTGCIRACLDAVLDFREENPGTTGLARIAPEIIARTFGLIHKNTQKAQKEEGKIALRDHPKNPERE